jgi:sec-independent protein translocase protein TatA
MLAIGLPGLPELLVIAFVATLLFGKRLPDTFRSLGKSLFEFKKGMQDVTDPVSEVKQAALKEIGQVLSAPKEK